MHCVYIVYITENLKERSSVYSVHCVYYVQLDRIYGLYMSKVNIDSIVYILENSKERSSVYSVYCVYCV